MAFNDKQRLITDEDIGLFDVYFEAILDHEESFKCFTQFLHSTYNSESCEFLDKVNEFRKIKHDRKRSHMAAQIYEKYIVEGSSLQLNIRGDLKNKIAKVLFPADASHSSSSLESPNRIAPKSDCTSPQTTPFQRRNSSDSSSSDLSSLNETSSSTSDKRSSVDAPSLHSCPKNLFDEVESMILLSLKESHFKSFLESGIFKQYLKTQPLKTLYEIGSVRSNTTLFYMDSLGDLKSERFSLNELQFIKDQMVKTEPNEWEVIGQSKDHRCYLSTKTFDFGGTLGLQFFKFEVTFPFGLTECMNTFLEQEYRLKYDGNLSFIQQLGYSEHKAATNGSSTSLASSVTQEIYKLGWPLDNREFILTTAGVFDRTDNMYVIGKKTCITDKAPPTKKGTVNATCIGGWGFKPVNEHSTKYYQLFYIDFKGNVPRAVIRSILKDRAKSFSKVGLKYIKLNEKRGFICKEDNMVWKSINENGQVDLQ